MGVCKAGSDGGGPGWRSLLSLHPLCPFRAVWVGQPFWEESFVMVAGPPLLLDWVAGTRP